MNSIPLLVLTIILKPMGPISDLLKIFNNEVYLADKSEAKKLLC